MNKQEFNSWNEFQLWYYAVILKRPLDKRPNLKMRRGEQKEQQKFFDNWRKHMGYHAPWTNLDMILYAYGKAKALAELKVGNEEYGKSNLKALLDLAKRAQLPLYEFRWFKNNKLVVTLLWEPDTTIKASF